MELRKEKEIEYYDKETEKSAGGFTKEAGSLGGFNTFLLESYNFLRKFLKDKCKEKKILDYGCGNGVHSTWLAEYGGKVTGIDLSEKSLQIAKERVKARKLEDKIEFLLRDCEDLKFPNNYFDIVFDGGTFSSLDLNKALAEISRVLKPDGFLIGIETLGHNPFTNFKRKINQLTGKRTKWAAEHIFKTDDLKRAEKYFRKIETHFFHLISWIIFPILNLPGGIILLKLFERIDYFLISIFPFLGRFSFKIVFIFSNPRKQNEKTI
jgi:ubiquinone/menaquinone biosynthesis C-methylase UbiE